MRLDDNPQAPRSYLENVANHLAWRRTSHVSNLVVLGVLVVLAVAVPIVFRHPAALVSAGIAGLVALLVLVIDRLHARQLSRRPVTREAGPPSGWGMSSNAAAVRSVVIVATILVGLTAFTVITDGARGWVMLAFGLPVVAFVALLALSGLKIRSRKWELLRSALRDPQVVADLRNVQATYPPYAQLPFSAPTDEVRLD